MVGGATTLVGGDLKKAKIQIKCLHLECARVSFLRVAGPGPVSCGRVGSSHTRAIQLSGEVLSTDEAASVELREAEAVHRTRSLHCLFKATPTTPCVCQELLLETGVS